MQVSKIIFLLFGYDSDMICCYNLFMAWFCSYDFDMVSVRNWDGSKLRFWWVKIVFLLFLGFLLSFLNMSWTHINIISKSYQNRMKSISKPKACLGAGSFSFFEANPSGTVTKPSVPTPYQNHEPTFNSYPNHILKAYLRGSLMS